jgi:hypothetical protein
MQAQDYGPAKWAIGQRSKGLTDADVDAALAGGSIVRTHVLRPTWHFVAREDLRWLLALTGPRIQRGTASRWRELGLDPRTLARSVKAIASALEGGNRLTRGEIGELLERSRIDRSGQRLPHILMHCELEAVICSGGLDGKQHTYALVDKRAPRRTGEPSGDRAVVELVRRYLSSHGPASVQDLRWWSSLTVADIKRALEELGHEVVCDDVNGIELWTVAGAASSRTSKPRGAELLHVYDELLVGYSETRYLGDPRADAARAAWGDRSIPMGVVLLNGGVTGHWRRTARRNALEVEVRLYDRPAPSTRTALQKSAQELGAFVGLRATLRLERM